MRGKRIVAFFQHLPPYSGAAALRGHSILKSLSTRETFAHITAYCSNSNPSQINGVDVHALGGIEVENSLPLRHRLWRELLMGLAAGWRMFMVQKRPHLAIISSPGYIAAIVLVFFARLRRVPYVLEMRDIYPQVYAGALLMRSVSPGYRLLLAVSRKMYANAQLVICATKGLENAVLADCPKANVQTVYNGFPNSFMNRRGTKHERFTVCFHGVLGFFQDIDMLLTVVEKLQQHDIDCVVVGYGRKESQITASQLKNLRFLGRLPFDKTIDEIEKCHVGLCLRVQSQISEDAFPVKVWEYLGLGIPSIVSPACEAGDFVGRNNCGFEVAGGDIDGVLDAILLLREHQTELNRFSEACRLVSSEYTRESAGRKIGGLIYELSGTAEDKNN
ncbi:MAG: glycosyltransferase family 4 protein [Parvibaculales bacterium]